MYLLLSAGTIGSSPSITYFLSKNTTRLYKAARFSGLKPQGLPAVGSQFTEVTGIPALTSVFRSLFPCRRLPVYGSSWHSCSYFRIPLFISLARLCKSQILTSRTAPSAPAPCPAPPPSPSPDQDNIRSSVQVSTCAQAPVLRAPLCPQAPHMTCR